MKNEAYKGGAMTLVGHSTTYLEAYTVVSLLYKIMPTTMVVQYTLQMITPMILNQQES